MTYQIDRTKFNKGDLVHVPASTTIWQLKQGNAIRLPSISRTKEIKKPSIALFVEYRYRVTSSPKAQPTMSPISKIHFDGQIWEVETANLYPISPKR